MYCGCGLNVNIITRKEGMFQQWKRNKRARTVVLQNPEQAGLPNMYSTDLRTSKHVRRITLLLFIENR